MTTPKVHKFNAIDMYRAFLSGSSVDEIAVYFGTEKEIVESVLQLAMVLTRPKECNSPN